MSLHEDSQRRHLHAVRNALNTIGMNAEVMKLSLTKADYGSARSAADIIIEQCSRSSDELEKLFEEVGL